MHPSRARARPASSDMLQHHVRHVFDFEAVAVHLPSPPAAADIFNIVFTQLQQFFIISHLLAGKRMVAAAAVYQSVGSCVATTPVVVKSGLMSR